MTEIVKDSFYRSRYYELSVSEWSQGGKDNIEKKKLKELSKQPIPQDVINESLKDFGKTAQGHHYHYLSFVCINRDLNGIAVFIFEKNHFFIRESTILIIYNMLMFLEII